MIEAGATYPGRGAAWRVAGILAIATFFAFLDRQIIALLVDPIRQTLDISDTQIGILQGPAFIIFYLLFGFPIGRMVERYNRRNIIVGGIILWSLMTIACGLSSSFWQLFAARAGVGVGEACLAPAAYSLLADYFPRKLRGRAIGFVAMASSLGSGMSFVIGGMVLSIVPGSEQADLPLFGALYGWQICFVAVGAPGLLLALSLTLMKETPRLERISGRVGSMPPLLPFLRSGGGAVLSILATAALLSLVGYALTAWKASFYIRELGLSSAEVGVAIGFLTMAGGALGGVIGGFTSDAFARKERNGGRLMILPLATGVAIPLLILWAMIDNVAISLASLLFIQMSLAAGATSVPGILVDIIPNELRGRMTAIMAVSNTAVGAGAGPLTIALASDILFPGADGLRASVLSVLPVLLGMACVISFVGRARYDHARQRLLTGQAK